jgi:endonuclease/exonuclease/phosphatase family metal-dependent hydrolase
MRKPTSRSAGRPRRRRFDRIPRLAAALTVAFGTAAGALVAPAPATAALGDQPLVSYNMQGATSGQDSKWTTTVGGYVERAEVVALQEAGASPPGTFVQNIAQPALPQHGNQGFVQHHRWQFGHASYEVYFLQTDANGGTGVGGRVNTALVTQRPADEVTAVPNPDPNGRAALGVRFGDTWYYSFHARSMGGQPNDAPAMIAAVDATVPINQTWVVLGDFNREPQQLQPTLAQPWPIYAAQDGQGRYLPTQQSGHALDYAVARANVAGVQLNRLGGASSDHYAFALGALRAAAEPTARYHSDRAVESMQAGGVLDADHEGTGNDTGIVSHHRTGGPNQTWGLDFYDDNTVRFRGRASGRCIDIHHSDTAEAGRDLVLWDCNDTGNQRWHADAEGNDEVRLRNVAHPDLCLDVAGAPSTPDAGPIVVWGCNDTANQRWLFTPAAAGTDVDRSPPDLSARRGPSTVENIRAGGVMDADHGRTDNGTGIVSYHRTGAANQGWNLDWYGRDKVRLRGVGSNRCVDIRHSDTAEAGRDLVLWDCNDTATQQWRTEQLDGGLVLLHNASHPELCVDVSGAPDVPDAGKMIVWPCAGSPNQQFLLTPFDPTGTPEHDHPRDEL